MLRLAMIIPLYLLPTLRKMVTGMRLRYVVSTLVMILAHRNSKLELQLAIPMNIFSSFKVTPLMVISY